MNLNLNTSRSISDLLGASASGICLIHCILTPVLFAAHAAVHGSHEHHDHHHHHHPETPMWWAAIDLVFIFVSLLAVYHSAKHSAKTWMKYALWASWLALSLAIVNEKMGWAHLGELVVYIPAAALIGLHLYNRKYCQC
ncbi:MAG: MerC domain-containing protein [Bacteroidota bacterium]